jgi:predicted dehydrogenase
MRETPRIALIGAGKIAELGHLPGFAQAGARVTALCDVNERHLQALANAYGIERRYQDWRGMLAAGGFDAVSICTPPALHSEMAVACAQQGLHILVEKPMALTVQQCDAMIAAADRAGVVFMVAHNQRFSPRHVVAKEILDAGQLGAPRRVHTVFAHAGPEHWSPDQAWYFNPVLSGPGVLLDLGYHKIDLLRWLLDQEVTAIRAFAAAFEKSSAVDDAVVAAVQFSGGTIGSLQVSWVERPGFDDFTTIHCERGVIRIPSQATEPVCVAEQRRSGLVVESTYLYTTSDPVGWFGAVAAFVETVQHGGQSPVPGTEGKATLAAVLAAYASGSPGGETYPSHT